MQSIANDFRQLRRAGYTPQQAIYAARILRVWRRAEEQGLVRLVEEYEQENYFDVYDEPDTEKERNAICDAINRLGCVVVIGQYRLPDSEEDDWVTADSVGFCIYDRPLCPLENINIPEIMAQTIDALTQARKAQWGDMTLAF